MSPDSEQQRHKHLLNRWFNQRLQDEEELLTLKAIGIPPSVSLLEKIHVMDIMISLAPLRAESLGLEMETGIILRELHNLLYTSRVVVPAMKGNPR